MRIARAPRRSTQETRAATVAMLNAARAARRRTRANEAAWN